MALIWIENKDGRLFHLPIKGVVDLNHPYDPVRIPTSAVFAFRNNLTENPTVVFPDERSFQFDFRPPGLIGSCNQCGQCCSHPSEPCINPKCGYDKAVIEGFHTCPRLTIIKKNKGLIPGNTECSVWDDLLDTFKGCLYPPERNEIRPWMIDCGYSYPPVEVIP